MTTKKILIVDDEVAIVAILKELLQGVGYSVITAYNGLEAMEQLAKNEKVDLLIIDFHMPYVNGKQVIEAIRNNQENNKIPIIMITGSANDCNSFPMENTYQTFIEKPFDIDEIAKTVKRFIG